MDNNKFENVVSEAEIADSESVTENGTDESIPCNPNDMYLIKVPVSIDIRDLPVIRDRALIADLSTEEYLSKMISYYL